MSNFFKLISRKYYPFFINLSLNLCQETILMWVYFWTLFCSVDLHVYFFANTTLSLFPGGSEVKASACNAEDLGSIPGLGRSPEEGNGNPLQYSCLENPMDGGAWWAIVHGVAKTWTRLSNFISIVYNKS